MIVDVWMQHPTERHSSHEMFASLRRWTHKTPRAAVITPEMTLAAMDEGGVSVGLAAAWCGPEGWLISHYPMITAAKALEGLDALGLDEEAKGLFLAGNAARVFNLEVKACPP